MYNWRDDIFYVTGALSSDNELEGVDIDELVDAAAQRIVDENGADYYDCPEYAVQEEASEFAGGGSMTLWAIPRLTRLYGFLVDWYDIESAIYENARNAFCDDDNMYFVTGMGYDIMSADLLGGTADGRATRDFDEFVEEYC